jgi:hypothetical protein
MEQGQATSMGSHPRVFDPAIAHRACLRGGLPTPFGPADHRCAHSSILLSLVPDGRLCWGEVHATTPCNGRDSFSLWREAEAQLDLGEREWNTPVRLNTQLGTEKFTQEVEL